MSLAIYFDLEVQVSVNEVLVIKLLQLRKSAAVIWHELHKVLEGNAFCVLRRSAEVSCRCMCAYPNSPL